MAHERVGGFDEGTCQQGLWHVWHVWHVWHDCLFFLFNLGYMPGMTVSLIERSHEPVNVIARHDGAPILFP
jgi:hypothetical protein